jgi:hypothetical protein
MANSNADLDELAQKAANEIRSCQEGGERVSVAAIARQYGVHKNRVHRRLKGIESRTTRKPVNCKRQKRSNLAQRYTDIMAGDAE